MQIWPVGFPERLNAYRFFRRFGSNPRLGGRLLNPDQSLDDVVHCIQADQLVLRNHPMPGTFGLLQHRASQGTSLRIEEDSDDAGGGPLAQFDACGHVRTPRSGI
jgi:hypothetical protein